MKVINLFALVLGILVTSACASNEVAEDTDATKAAMEENKDDAVSEANAKIDEAEEDAEAKAAEAEAETDAKAEEMETDATEVYEAVSSAGDPSGNLVSTCTHGDQQRIITVVYDNDETDTVCEVTYEKDSGVETLWTANFDREYCKERAAEFVAKQEGWGWTCSNLE